MDKIPFHIYGKKELDYVMTLIATEYCTNEGIVNHTTKWDYVNSENKSVRKTICYPEVISDHFQYWHSVDDHNTKRHAPIHLFHISQKTPWLQLEFRKLITMDRLVHNRYILKELSQ